MSTSCLPYDQKMCSYQVSIPECLSAVIPTLFFSTYAIMELISRHSILNFPVLFFVYFSFHFRVFSKPLTSNWLMYLMREQPLDLFCPSNVVLRRFKKTWRDSSRRCCSQASNTAYGERMAIIVSIIINIIINIIIITIIIIIIIIITIFVITLGAGRLNGGLRWSAVHRTLVHCTVLPDKLFDVWLIFPCCLVANVVNFLTYPCPLHYSYKLNMALFFFTQTATNTYTTQEYVHDCVYQA